MTKQNTPEWHAVRRKHLGASDTPAIMGVSPWKTPYQLWQEKLGLSEGQQDNVAMRFGRENEEKARVAYQVMTGNFVEPEVVFHPTIPYLMASLDGLSEDKKVAVEIKNANADDHALAKEGKVPDKYYPQLQHQLECAQLDYVHYFSYHKDEGVVVSVDRDDKYIKKMLGKLEEFWEMVQKFEMPELTDKDLREQDELWIAKARDVFEDGQKANLYKKKYDEGKKELQELAGNTPSRGGGYFFKKSTAPGRVVYKNIPELQNFDLDAYRGKPVESWRLTYSEKN